MLRVVLDANIYISALLKPKGLQSKIVRKGFQGDFQIVISEKIFLEICRVLKYPKIAERLSVSNQEIKKFLERLIDVSQWTLDEVYVRACEDPNDDIYLACAKESRADFLVSGDQHLLKMKEFGATKVVMSRVFLELLHCHSNARRP